MYDWKTRYNCCTIFTPFVVFERFLYPEKAWKKELGAFRVCSKPDIVFQSYPCWGFHGLWGRFFLGPVIPPHVGSVFRSQGVRQGPPSKLQPKLHGGSVRWWPCRMCNLRNVRAGRGRCWSASRKATRQVATLSWGEQRTNTGQLGRKHTYKPGFYHEKPKKCRFWGAHGRHIVPDFYSTQALMIWPWFWTRPWRSCLFVSIRWCI